MVIKTLIIIFHLFFLNQYPFYTTCTENVKDTRTEYGGHFNIRLTNDSLFIYRDNLIFDKYARDGGLLYKNKETYLLVFAEGTCRITKRDYLLKFTNGPPRFY